MRAVNLLPRETSSRKLVLDRAALAAIAFTVVVGAALLGGFYLEKARAGTEQQRQAAAEAALARVQSQQASAHGNAPARLQIPVVLSQQEPWHVALDSALAIRVPWDVLLAQLEYVVPAKILLTSVTLGSASAATGAPNGTITLAGNAYSADDIAVFLSTLARVPRLSQVTLVSSSAASGAGVMNFQISAQVTLPVAPAPPAATDTTTTSGGQA